jgi:hypothetical protein
MAMRTDRLLPILPIALAICMGVAGQGHAQIAAYAPPPSIAREAAQAARAATVVPAAKTSPDQPGDTVEPVTVRPESPAEATTVASTDAVSLASPNFGPADAQHKPLTIPFGDHAVIGGIAVENPNPLWGLYSSISRQDHDGMPVGGWFPDQRLSREEALKSWTLEGAYAAFEEKSKGSLEPGKLADFIMLSDDVMTMPVADIWKTQVKLTVVGGKIVYQQ